MSKHVWKWMVPDKPGVWAIGGTDNRPVDVPKEIVVILKKPKVYIEGWCSFLMELPQFQTPQKKRITKRLWMRHEESLPDDPGHSVYEEQWVPVGVMLDLSKGWIFTEKKKEFEE